ncbi:hypothetical protein [Vitreoscilla stercoraria]|uniref:Uncharacterized protein n=1 Tax=Vitreoscilla stercoraria TaxID=61 RepID=A0ABY4EE54_VITST|nr:hypothetical protein [Vitreoscilla stercoraria]UOO93561.1 hypothetical protein LVJ81_05930 [Vitreoscilla stercoraria]
MAGLTDWDKQKPSKPYGFPTTVHHKKGAPVAWYADVKMPLLGGLSACLCFQPVKAGRWIDTNAAIMPIV